jgi:hypothetical protein
MTALPLRDFTAAEQDKLAAIEAAPAAAESVRERVARAMCDAGAEDGRWSWSEMHESIRDGYRQLADAAIATMRGPGSYVEQAVERHDGIVREATDLCWSDRHSRHCWPRIPRRPGRLLVRGRARRVRRAAPVSPLRAGEGGAPAEAERGERVNDTDVAARLAADGLATVRPRPLARRGCGWA